MSYVKDILVGRKKCKPKENRKDRQNEQIIYYYLILPPEARKSILQTFVGNVLREIFLQTYETAFFFNIADAFKYPSALVTKC